MRDVGLGVAGIIGGVGLGSTGVGAVVGAVAVMSGMTTAVVGSVKIIGAFSDVPSANISAVGDIANPLGAMAAASAGVAGGTPEQMLSAAKYGAIAATAVSAINPNDKLVYSTVGWAIAKDQLARAEADAADKYFGDQGRNREERSYLGIRDLRDDFPDRAGDRSERGDRDYAGKGSLLGDRDFGSDFGGGTGTDSEGGGYLGVDTDFGYDF